MIKIEVSFVTKMIYTDTSINRKQVSGIDGKKS